MRGKLGSNVVKLTSECGKVMDLQSYCGCGYLHNSCMIDIGPAIFIMHRAKARGALLYLTKGLWEINGCWWRVIFLEV